MRNSRSPNQLMFDGFETEFEKWLEPGNRWVLLSRVLTHTGHHVAAVLEAHIHWLHTITIRQTDKLKQSSLLKMTF